MRSRDVGNPSRVSRPCEKWYEGIKQTLENVVGAEPPLY